MLFLIIILQSPFIDTTIQACFKETLAIVKRLEYFTDFKNKMLNENYKMIHTIYVLGLFFPKHAKICLIYGHL